MAKAMPSAFAQGETIYREGDSGDKAFVVASGRVELSKVQQGASRPIRIVETGQVFGESGMVTGGIREDTARALGPVTLEALDRKAFLKSVQSKPEMALDVMGLLSQRLRDADEASLRAKAKKAGPTIIERLIEAAGFGRNALNGPPAKLDIRVCGFAGDDDGIAQKRLIAVFESLKTIRVRAISKCFDSEGQTESRSLRSLETLARRSAIEAGTDLIIWGEKTDGGADFAIRFTSRVAGDPAVVGLFGPWDSLPLTAEADPALDALIAAAALTALVPADAHRRALLGRAFHPTLKPAIEALKMLPLDLTKKERAQTHVCFAHVAATAAARDIAARGNGSIAADLNGLAQKAYSNALESLHEPDAPAVWTMIHKNAGLLLAQGGAATSAASLELAISHIEDALDTLDRIDMPWDWAALQEILGGALYRLDKTTDGTDGDILRESLTAYQNALLVFTRKESPQKWASLQTSVARVAQILGKQMHNPSLIEHAVEACEQALLVRSRARTPGLWASTQNNLGTALFLLAEMTERDAALTYAAEAFRAALSVYEVTGPVNMIAVVERNLARVEGVLAPMREHNASLIDWSEIGAAAEQKDDLDDVTTPKQRHALLNFGRAAAG